ncbi:MsnO8 family LLM class oxidoreductase [Arthrobacter sp. I2-34]|uniref:MsnO8 family LLM class oxidoreductase n=1 Tax=Arthrobacter hankyongi TaxID=2904801 RepID=A0ABS9L3I7_9MICC|nr:MsnO8 family LLM class oxidoreductase [Arthrobacter hankyongi]MCG2621240.1 MsnO8 family LLM class oxidoreductase [Arthrobacter hankyongi]
MKYSLVELAPVAHNGSKREALHAAVRAAREADELGYERIWYAEHHHTVGYAAQDPVSLIALAARETERIRVGSGAVLLNHYSPFSIAERFLQLEALTPGRIDLGLGRATAGPLIDAALRRDRNSRPQDDFSHQVQEILAYYHHGFGPDHPFSPINLTAGMETVPDVWVLGSSGNSAALAGSLGLGYAFAGFINPGTAVAALDAHRESFQSTPFGTAQRNTMLALNIVAADDEDTAHRLTWPARLLWRRVAASGQAATTPTLAQAEAELPLDAKQQSSTFDGKTIPAQISGSPDTLKTQLEKLVEATGATEIMIQDMLIDPDLRSRSRALIAEAITRVDLSETADQPRL